MKTITKFLFFISPILLLSASSAQAQCLAGYTWSQTANNVVDFTNTSTPIITNSTFFYWNFGDNQYDLQLSPSHTYSAPGHYQVCLTMYDSISMCQTSFCDSVTVYGTVFCNVNASTNVTSPATCSTCADGSAYATMSGGVAPYTYSWSDGETTQSAIALSPGVYSVCITDANGCTACDTAISMPYQNINCNATFTLSQTQNNIVDFVNTSTNSPSNYTLYTWNYGDGHYDYSNSASNMSHTYQNPGTYIVCLYFADSLSGCSSYTCDSVTVYGNSNPTACNASFVIYPDSVNTFQAWIYNTSTGGPNMQYYWSWGDNTYDTVAYPSHVYTSSGSYNICLTVYDAQNQCADTMCQLLWVPRLSEQAASTPYYVNVVGPTGIQEQQETNWSLFPNPATTSLSIKTDYNLQNRKYRILDIAGRTVTANTLDGNKIDVSSLDKGMYILQIENSKGGFSAQRFMKD